MPAATARLLARRYLTPKRSFIAGADRPPYRAFEQITLGRQTLLRFAAAPDAPPGPRLLVVPGHDGHLRQFQRLLRHLCDQGASVDLLVLPGHLGPAPGLCSLAEIVEALREVGGRSAPYDGLIAHCVGCNGSLIALQQLPLARRLVFVSAPLTLANLVRFGGRQYGLQGRSLARFVEEVSRLGAPYPIEAPWQPVDAPLLLLHARNDYAVPVADVADIETRWPGARLALYDHGDHNGLLGQRGTIAQIAGFLLPPR